MTKDKITKGNLMRYQFSVFSPLFPSDPPKHQTFVSKKLVLRSDRMCMSVSYPRESCQGARVIGELFQSEFILHELNLNPIRVFCL